MISKTTDVKITLTTVQHADTTEKYTAVYEGTLDCKNGSYYLRYTDTEPNIITIKKDSVRITKPQSASAMCFEQNREHISNYMTPAGRMSVSVFTHKLFIDFETEKRIFIKYRLMLNESLQTENDITIKIEEK